VNAAPEAAGGALPATRPPAPGTPGRSADQIRQDVEARRGQLAGSVELLRRRFGELTDWRGQLREHRTEIVAGAAIAGFVVGGWIALRRRRG
jgi:hypothetical protein